MGPFSPLIIILAILLVIPATILPGYRRPHGSIFLSSGAALVLLAVFCLLGGPGWVLSGLSTQYFGTSDTLDAFIPILTFGGVLLLLASWTLSLNAAAQARHWLWVAVLLCTGLLTFSMILWPSSNPLQMVVGYFVSPTAALVYAVRPSLLAW